MWVRKIKEKKRKFSTKSSAQSSGSLEGVAFDAVLLSVDKVITSALEGHPGTRVCRTIWEEKKTKTKVTSQCRSVM